MTNTGPVPLASLAVAASEPVSCPVTTLAAGATTTCSATGPASASDFAAGRIVFSAAATARDPNGVAVESAPSAARVIAVADTSISVTGSATPASVIAIGQRVTYAIALADTVSAPGGPSPAVICPGTTLTATAQMTCSATYAATEADIDSGLIENRASASGTAPGGRSLRSDPAVVVVTAASRPALTLFASASPAAVVAVGQVIHFSFLVQNDGNVALSGLALIGSLSQPAAPQSISCPITVLAPAQRTDCALDYAVRPSDLDDAAIVATTTASAAAATGQPISSNASTATVSTLASVSRSTARPVAAPPGATGPDQLGPTLGAGSGAMIAGGSAMVGGIALLMLSVPRARARRRHA